MPENDQKEFMDKANNENSGLASILAMTDQESVTNAFSSMESDDLTEVMKFLIEEGVIDFDEDEEE